MLLCVGNWQRKQSRLMSNIHNNTIASCKQVCSQEHVCRLLNPGKDFLPLFILCLNLFYKNTEQKKTWGHECNKYQRTKTSKTG